MKEHHHIPPSSNEIPTRGIDRRDFLKLAGFSFAGTVLAGCSKAPVEKAIPFLIKPEEVTPGLAYWYATTCGGCSAGCGVLTKNRDGRPIKLEGIKEHPFSQGGLCAVGQAHLLSLYDSQRLMNPVLNGKETTWEETDKKIISQLSTIQQQNGEVRFLSGTITSPTSNEIINRFLSSYNNGKHIMYDALSSSAILDAHEQTHGIRVLPHYRFDKAEVIVSFDADFLGTWISPVEFTADYRKGRTLIPKNANGNKSDTTFSYHIQFESNLSLTGSNADKRIAITPDEIGLLIQRLSNLISEKAGTTLFRTGHLMSEEQEKVLQNLAEQLWNVRGKSLVVCGVNNIEIQLAVNFINHLLGNYGETVDIENPSFQKQGDDKALMSLLKEIEEGKISALFLHNVNPVYDLPNGDALKARLKNIPLVVSFAERMDETTSCANVVCPEPHSLESWNDAESVAGIVTITQPVIQPFGKSRMLTENLATWMGKPQSAYDILRSEWEKTIFKRQTKEKSFQTFWDTTVHDGFANVESEKQKTTSFNLNALTHLESNFATAKSEGFSLVLYSKIALLDGRHAHNPWLQELPDPVTKIVWDNYISLSPKTAQQFDIAEGNVLRITETFTKQTLELPAHIQTGIHNNVVAIALGYGRMGTDRFTNIGPDWFEAKPTVEKGSTVGKNAAKFLQLNHQTISYHSGKVHIEKTGNNHTLACTQEHHSLREPSFFSETQKEQRPIIQQTSLIEYEQNPSAGSFPKHPVPSMWPEEHKYTGHHWGMVIDLNACTGCSACVISCQAENNTPSVGKDEVFRNREMTWLRIDRYIDEENEQVSVTHQPMMCQHCGNAPCETVCPVLATVHNDEGLNQQVYNRCVGTRYCANNCPYKVRRFNWFDYEHGDDKQKLVLNPDITVRERGVMEKCTFCIQRIQEGKIQAKKEGRSLSDGEIQPACQQSCPANAIVFGDMNDTNSELVKKMNDPRYYRVLEELGVRPSIGYMTVVRDREPIGEKENV